MGCCSASLPFLYWKTDHHLINIWQVACSFEYIRGCNTSGPLLLSNKLICKYQCNCKKMMTCPFLLLVAFQLFAPGLAQMNYSPIRGVYRNLDSCNERYVQLMKDFVSYYRSGPCSTYTPFMDCCYLAHLLPIATSGVFEIGDPCDRSSFITPFTMSNRVYCDMTTRGGWVDSPRKVSDCDCNCKHLLTNHLPNH